MTVLGGNGSCHFPPDIRGQHRGQIDKHNMETKERESEQKDGSHDLVLVHLSVNNSNVKLNLGFLIKDKSMKYKCNEEERWCLKLWKMSLLQIHQHILRCIQLILHAGRV